MGRAVQPLAILARTNLARTNLARTKVLATPRSHLSIRTKPIRL